MNSRGILIASGILGAVGILIGAFGAHVLPNILNDLSPDELAIREDWLETGVTYHMYHAVALLTVGLAGLSFSSSLPNAPKFSAAAIFWIIGIVIFSGCLYAMTLTGIKRLGALVPIGGVAFVVGWTLILVNGLKFKR